MISKFPGILPIMDINSSREILLSCDSRNPVVACINYRQVIRVEEGESYDFPSFPIRRTGRMEGRVLRESENTDSQNFLYPIAGQQVNCIAQSPVNRGN